MLLNANTEKPSNEIRIEEYYSWAEDYLKDLLILETDLEIILEDNYKIFVSVDFCDIIEHCIPSNYNLKILALRESPEHDKVIRNELARCGLFYLLDKIYKQPALLLPPYLQESIGFLKTSKYQLKNLQSDDRKNELKSYVEEIKSIFNSRGDKDKCSLETLKILGKIGPDIALVLSPFFMTGITGYTDFLNSRVTPFPRKFFPIEFLNYRDVISGIDQTEFRHIEIILNLLRWNKIFANKRDARAIRYIEELNRNMKQTDQNSIVLFTSSANHLFRFKELIKCNEPFTYLGFEIPSIMCERAVNKKKVPLLRDMRFFSTALLEISNLFTDLTSDANGLSKNNLTELLMNIRKEIHILKNFLDLAASGSSVSNISGVIKWDFQKDANKQLCDFKKLIDERMNADLMAILNSLSPLAKSRDEYINNFISEVDNIIFDDTFISFVDKRIEYVNSELSKHFDILCQVSKTKDIANMYKDFGWDSTFIYRDFG